MTGGEKRQNALSDSVFDSLLPISQAVEMSPITTVVTGLDGRIEYVNAAFVASTGYSKEEAIGQNPRIVSSGEQPKSVYRDMWKTISSGGTWKGLFHNKRKNGDLYWEEAIISPVRDAEGRVAHFLALKQDVSAPKAMEERLRLQAAAMDSTLGFIVIADARAPDLPLIYTNEAFYRVTGYSAEEAIGRNPRYLHAREPGQPGLEEIRRGLCEKRPCQALIRNYRKDGTFFWNELYISPIKNEAGEVTHFVGISNDVTELVATRNELFENERRLRISQEMANIGTWDWDIRTGKIQTSERIGALFGLSDGLTEIDYYTLISAIHPEDRDSAEKAIAECLLTGSSFTIEHRINSKDGVSRWLLESGNVTRDPGGRPAHLLGIVQDLTDRKLAELEIIRSREEAIRANRVKSEFLSSMSHELRTPMNAILGFGQLLERDRSLGESQLDFVGEIVKAGRHLLELINEVLDLSKIEAGKIELAPESIDCVEVIDEAVGLVSPLADRRSITIARIIEAKPTVVADRLRLKQTLVNLLSNAIKYNRDGGRVELRLSAEGGRARLEVADTGYGIPAERMGELFAPFNRLGRDGGDIEGSGIGLHISKRLVELMRGTIGAESREGVGSTFWIELPLAYAPNSGQDEGAGSPQRSTPASAAAIPGTCSTLLYLEDNPANLRLVSQILASRDDIYLLAAQSASLGLELAEAHRPDLILLDLNMPDIDGYEVLRRIRSKPWGSKVPVVALTALAMSSEIEKGRAAGFDDYLTKPLDIERFLSALDRLLYGAKP